MKKRDLDLAIKKRSFAGGMKADGENNSPSASRSSTTKRVEEERETGKQAINNKNDDARGSIQGGVELSPSHLQRSRKEWNEKQAALHGSTQQHSTEDVVVGAVPSSYDPGLISCSVTVPRKGLCQEPQKRRRGGVQENGTATIQQSLLAKGAGPEPASGSRWSLSRQEWSEKQAMLSTKTTANAVGARQHQREKEVTPRQLLDNTDVGKKQVMQELNDYAMMALPNTTTETQEEAGIMQQHQQQQANDAATPGRPNFFAERGAYHQEMGGEPERRQTIVAHSLMANPEPPAAATEGASSLQDDIYSRPGEYTGQQQQLQSSRLDNEQSTALAVPVEEEDPVALASPVDGKQVKERQQASRRQLRWGIGALVAGFVVVLVIVLIVIIVVQKQNSSATTATAPTEAPTGAPSTTPSMSPTQMVVPDLPEATLDAIISKPLSPQARAYQWMLDDPFLADYSEIRRRQRFALVTFYYATNGEQWDIQTNWLSYQIDECDWFSAAHAEITTTSSGQLIIRENPDQSIETCSNRTTTKKEYEYLTLHSNNLGGTIPDELFLLTSLREIQLVQSDFTGTLSTRLGDCANLQKLALSGTGLKGPIPSEIGKLQQLVELNLAVNDLGSTLPEEFWELESLEFLDLNNAALGGTISRNISKLTSLVAAKLSRNAFVGTIPSELGLLDDLVLLWVHINEDVTGEMPAEVCDLRNEEGSEDGLRFLNADCAGYGVSPRVKCLCCTGCCGGDDICLPTGL